MMRVISDLSVPGPAFRERKLLVLLPGADMSADDFRTHGFLDAVRELGQPIDVIAVDTGMECYLEDRIVALLHDEIIEPAHRLGPVVIWLVGISLGGMGALLYAQAHRNRIEGVILLAPFIGTRGLIAEAERAGGLRQWSAAAAGSDATIEHRLLTWLAGYDGAVERWPEMRLAYGVDDRFAAAYRLLGALLPAAQVTTSPGGHDWPTWMGLWQEVLRAAPFAALPLTERPCVGQQ